MSFFFKLQDHLPSVCVDSGCDCGDSDDVEHRGRGTFLLQVAWLCPVTSWRQAPKVWFMTLLKAKLLQPSSVLTSHFRNTICIASKEKRSIVRDLRIYQDHYGNVINRELDL